MLSMEIFPSLASAEKDAPLHQAGGVRRCKIKCCLQIAVNS
jgi:hypothetical protein